MGSSKLVHPAHQKWDPFYSKFMALLSEFILSFHNHMEVAQKLLKPIDGWKMYAICFSGSKGYRTSQECHVSGISVLHVLVIHQIWQMCGVRQIWDFWNLSGQQRFFQCYQITIQNIKHPLIQLSKLKLYWLTSRFIINMSEIY